MAVNNYALLDAKHKEIPSECPTADDALQQAIPVVKPERQLRHTELKHSKLIGGEAFGLSDRVCHPCGKTAVRGLDKIQASASCHVPRLPGCPAAATEALLKLGAKRFVISPRYKCNDEWSKLKGALDLFLGSKRHAKKLIRRGCPWVLTYEILDDAVGQDLLSKLVRTSIESLLDLGCFLMFGAGPVCSSLSVAITPPVRSSVYPEGLPHIPASMIDKVKNGNSFGYWVAKLVSKYSSSHFVWVENPDSSFLWRLKSWQSIADRSLLNPLRVDFCRYGTPWRKRTRFLTNIGDLVNTLQLCQGGHQHKVLWGTGPGSQPWTKIAEPYPHGLADLLAAASAHSCGWSAQAAKPDTFSAKACAQCDRRY